jgi:hypothetical protein
MTWKSEFEDRTWKKIVAAYFNVLFQYLTALRNEAGDIVTLYDMFGEIVETRELNTKQTLCSPNHLLSRTFMKLKSKLFTYL